MSDSKPIDPYWWCREDERLAKEFWEKVERPYLMQQFAILDDPKFWEAPKKTEGKSGVTVIELLVVVAILATLAGLIFSGVSTRKGENGEPPTSWNLYTAKHDGHWFVKDASGGVCHHPDCPCYGRLEAN